MHALAHKLVPWWAVKDLAADLGAQAVGGYEEVIGLGLFALRERDVYARG